jgi:glycine betaine/proline transport system ATP-binding protein
MEIEARAGAAALPRDLAAGIGGVGLAKAEEGAGAQADADVVIRVERLYKLYGQNKQQARDMLAAGAGKDEILRKTGVTVAVDDVSFDVERGKVFCLIGLSGSGKSTVIRCLNRLCKPTSGRVLFNGTDINALSKKGLLEYRRRSVSMVFQSFGIMSHRNVLDNVAYGLEVRGMRRAEREARAMEMVRMVGLEGWERKGIGDLSGGMRQRVGIARALANDPEALLMDEPFSALDPLVRRDMQFELLSIQERLGKTIVFITHDINEAFKLGNTVGIMRDGRVVQIGAPEELASRPADAYVADFVNSANKMNILSVRSVMQRPGCLIHSRDGIHSALRQMREQGVSSAYVVGDRMEFRGVVTLDKALRVRAGEMEFRDAIETDVPRAGEDEQIADLLPMAAAARFPIAVVDEGGRLRGIVTKAEIIASMI